MNNFKLYPYEYNDLWFNSTEILEIIFQSSNDLPLKDLQYF